MDRYGVKGVSEASSPSNWKAKLPFTEKMDECVREELGPVLAMSVRQPGGDVGSGCVCTA